MSNLHILHAASSDLLLFSYCYLTTWKLRSQPLHLTERERLRRTIEERQRLTVNVKCLGKKWEGRGSMRRGKEHSELRESFLESETKAPFRVGVSRPCDFLAKTMCILYSVPLQALSLPPNERCKPKLSSYELLSHFLSEDYALPQVSQQWKLAVSFSSLLSCQNH